MKFISILSSWVKNVENVNPKVFAIHFLERPSLKEWERTSLVTYSTKYKVNLFSDTNHAG